MKTKSIREFPAGAQVRVGDVLLRISWKNKDGSVFVRQEVWVTNFLEQTYLHWVGPFEVDGSLDVSEVE